jgi:hypothetical protein
MKHGHPRVWRRCQRYFVERDLWKGDADWYRYLVDCLSVLPVPSFPRTYLRSKEKFVSSHFPLYGMPMYVLSQPARPACQ